VSVPPVTSSIGTGGTALKGQMIRIVRRDYTGSPEPIGLIMVTVLDTLGRKIKENLKK